jgi:uncharacterized protein (TIGR03083 family)
MQPILAAHLLRPLEDRLLLLLDELTLEEWARPTIVPGWQVRHVAGHLLDTALRKVSMLRDGFAPRRPAALDAESIKVFVNQLNAAGVAAYGSLSPRVLRALMEPASRAMCEFHEALDPFAPAAFAVSWAGESESLNWFDTARELTERWHHQQQIRLALSKPGIETPELYHPVLDCFVRALPHTYRNVAAPPGTHVRISITGDCGGEWFLERGENGWALAKSPAGVCLASVGIPQAIAWRVFTKGIAFEETRRLVAIEGDSSLALPSLRAVAIVG